MAAAARSLPAKKFTTPPAPAPAPTPNNNHEFARRLRRAMQARQMSQSDLAAALWGRRDVLYRGKTVSVARNRERISVYLSGKSYPREQHLQKLAEVLGMSLEELSPGASAPRVPPPVMFSMLDGINARLRVDAVIPADVALQVTRLINKARGVGASEA